MRRGSVVAAMVAVGLLMSAGPAGAARPVERESDRRTPATEATKKVAGEQVRRPVPGTHNPVPRKQAFNLGRCWHVPSDFNGDGFADVAVSQLKDSIDEFGGAVEVFYGKASGAVDATYAQYFDHYTPGMPTEEDPADQHGYGNDFGFKTASGYFNGDCYADLVIGGVHDRFRVLYGGPGGLTTDGARAISFRELGTDDDLVGEGVNGENLFGSVFTVGDFNGDRRDDLVIGAPRAGNPWVGGIAFIPGAREGLMPQSAHWLPGDLPGMPFTSTGWEWFGEVLAAGDFDHDGRDDLAVGFERDAVDDKGFAGSVVILPGSPEGPTSFGAQRFTQDSPGLPDVAEWNDQFGYSLAAADFSGDGYADLAVGQIHEGFAENSEDRGGAVTLLKGSPDGLSTEGVQYWRQLTPGVPGTDNNLAMFGFSLAAADFDGDHRPDLAIAAPGASAGQGQVIVLRGGGDGLITAGAKFFGAAALAVSSSDIGMVLHAWTGADGNGRLGIGLPMEPAGGLVVVLTGGPSGLINQGEKLSPLGHGTGPQLGAWFGSSMA